MPVGLIAFIIFVVGVIVGSVIHVSIKERRKEEAPLIKKIRKKKND